MRRHLVASAIIVALAGCGDAEDTGLTDSAGENAEGNVSSEGDDTSEKPSSGEDDSAQESSPEGDDPSGGDDVQGDDEAEEVSDAVLSDSADEVLDLAFGRLDAATYDGRSQCLLDTDDVSGQEGLRAANRSLMLADGHDVWTVCLTTRDLVDGSTITVTDPTGVSWGAGTFVSLSEIGSDRSLGYGQEGTMPRGLTVSDGSSLRPVGHSYVRAAADGTERHVATIYLVLPSARPAGAWTVSVTGGDTSQVNIDTPTCKAVGAEPSRPWPIDPDLRIVSFSDEIPWHEAANTADLLSAFRPLSHCLAAPLVIGQTWRDGVTLLQAAARDAGLTPAEPNFVLECSEGADVVTGQSPVPNGLLDERPTLFASIPCPPMPDLVGMTVTQAEATLQGMAQPPYTLVGRVSGLCTDGEAIVTRTFPREGETSYLVGGVELNLDLYC